jgi:hypothetical protein
MAVLSACIQASVRAVLDVRRNLAFGRAVGSERASDEALRRSLLLPHQSEQQTFRCFLIAPTLTNFIQNSVVLINSAPQPELPAFDLYEQLRPNAKRRRVEIFGGVIRVPWMG